MKMGPFGALPPPLPQIGTHMEGLTSQSPEQANIIFFLDWTKNEPVMGQNSYAQIWARALILTFNWP